MQMITSIWQYAMTMKWSFVAFVATAVLGLVGMGLLGFALYYPVAPVLALRFPPHATWHGDWVWPTVIVVGMAWSLGFIFAGALNLALEARDASQWLRTLAYITVLWLWALLLWWVALQAQF